MLWCACAHIVCTNYIVEPIAIRILIGKRKNCTYKTDSAGLNGQHRKHNIGITDAVSRYRTNECNPWICNAAKSNRSLNGSLNCPSYCRRLSCWVCCTSWNDRCCTGLSWLGIWRSPAGTKLGSQPGSQFYTIPIPSNCSRNPTSCICMIINLSQNLFWPELHASPYVELSHPLNPVQSDHVHYALHNIKHEHHQYSNDEKTEGPEHWYMWVAAR